MHARSGAQIPPASRGTGAELQHVVLYLDAPRVPAAAYTAMSRVRMQAHCLIGGIVQPHHFEPAR